MDPSKNTNTNTLHTQTQVTMRQTSERTEQTEITSQAQRDLDNAILQRYVPGIARQLQEMEDLQRATYEQISNKLDSLSNKISNISSSQTPLQINIRISQGSTTPVASTTHVYHASTSGSLPPPPNTVNQNYINAPVATTVSYKLNRNIRTVTDLYKEWTIGLNGEHSVEYMNTNHPRWCSSHERSFYMRRRRIIKTCEKYAASNGISVQDAVRQAEAKRATTNKTLDYLSKNCSTIFS